MRKQQVLNLLAIAKIEVTVTEIHIKRAHNLQDLGFQAFDALHLACAEAARVDAFLTTDDRLLRRATSYSDRLGVLVANPVSWTLENNFVLEGETYDDPS